MRTSRTKANANARQQVIKNHKFQFKFILLWLWILDFAMSGQVGALCIHLLGFVCLFMSMYKFDEFFNSSFTRPHVWNAGPQHNGMAWYRTEWNEMKWEWGMVMGVWGIGRELPLLCCIIAG